MKVFTISVVCLILFSCSNPQKKMYYYYEGPIQGTTFHITYEWDKDLAPEIDSLLQNFNKSLSNYDENSVVSKINNNISTETDELFDEMFNMSFEVYKKSDGAFDITVAPVVNAWGFGWIKKTDTEIPDSAEISKIIKYVGMDKMHLADGKITKDFPESMIVTNAIAQGLSVDYVSDYLFGLGLSNFLVEIGGEVYCYGVNGRGEPWRIGVDKPVDGSGYENRENQIIINLSGYAIATSGNYRKYIENNNQKYGHSIDPRTGFPAENSLLSVSVIGESCMICDAWATAFMVCGLDKSLEILKSNSEINAYFIYKDSDGQTKVKMTDGFGKYISE